LPEIAPPRQLKRWVSFLMASYILIAVIVSYLPVLFASYFLFDGMIRKEYFDHHAQWEADGKPCGIFWVPRESIFLEYGSLSLVRLGSSVASQRKFYVWLFLTPAWMQRDNTARRLLFWSRALLFGWLFALVGFLLLVIFR
jgi:hypothetical protein